VRFVPRQEKSREKTASISSGYVEAFLSKNDDVAGQRSLFAVGESFATGPYSNFQKSLQKRKGF